MMGNHIYKKIEIVGSSKISSDDAVKNALSKAAESVKSMRWFEIVEVRGAIDDDKIEAWQVTLKIGFTLED